MVWLKYGYKFHSDPYGSHTDTVHRRSSCAPKPFQLLKIISVELLNGEYGAMRSSNMDFTLLNSLGSVNGIAFRLSFCCWRKSWNWRCSCCSNCCCCWRKSSAIDRVFDGIRFVWHIINFLLHIPPKHPTQKPHEQRSSLAQRSPSTYLSQASSGPLLHLGCSHLSIS